MKEKFDKYINKNPFTNYSDLTYKILSEQIIKLKIKPGTILNESNISNNLNISRTPVNAAIKKLIKSGLATKDDNEKFTKVSELNMYHLNQYYNSRMAIEPYCAMMAAKNFDDKQIEKLEILTSNIKKSCDIDNLSSDLINKYIENEIEFHKFIVIGNENKYLNQMFKVTFDIGLRYRYYMLNFIAKNQKNINIKEFLQDSIKFHESIFFSIKHHLSKIAYDQMKEDINRMIPLILDSNFYIFAK
ncbi:GntR family transcriptional regulator [Anaerococcus rubeinfantis]|uniref:GntR family transcriptional regulator n=1 Tax=Anaerococcus rubeinfantis TaxID=1720199 RepID=UPI00073E74CE|nr:GntR family transcriptional regulator [Anaerococcus rubeinfantis]